MMDLLSATMVGYWHFGALSGRRSALPSVLARLLVLGVDGDTAGVLLFFTGWGTGIGLAEADDSMRIASSAGPMADSGSSKAQT